MTISFQLSRDVATNEIKLHDKINTIMDIRKFTFCDLKHAKDMVENFVDCLNKANINNPVLRSDIRHAINDLEGKDLIDIMRFIQAIKNTSLNNKNPNPNLENFLN